MDTYCLCHSIEIQRCYVHECLCSGQIHPDSERMCTQFFKNRTSFIFLFHREKFSVMVDEYNHPNSHTFFLSSDIGGKMQHSLLPFSHVQQFLNDNQERGTSGMLYSKMCSQGSNTNPNLHINISLSTVSRCTKYFTLAF